MANCYSYIQKKYFFLFFFLLISQSSFLTVAQDYSLSVEGDNDFVTPVSEKQEEGNYEIDFNASSLASGMYIYRMQAGSFTQIKKMLILK